MPTDISLVCQFNLKCRNGLIPHLVECVEELFSSFNYNIKKIFTSFGETVRSPGYNKFKSFINPDHFYTISFQSDYNSRDFEPETRLYIRIDNSPTKGSEYVLPEPLVKFTVVINDLKLLESAEKTYKTLLLALSNIPQLEMVGYSFQLPNSYGAVSFSVGILRKPDMSPSLQALARWYNDSNTKRSVLGLYNCFTGLTKEQYDALKKTFGQENIDTVNGVILLKNVSMTAFDINSYFSSSEYCRLCDRLKNEFSFLRMDCV